MEKERILERLKAVYEKVQKKEKPGIDINILHWYQKKSDYHMDCKNELLAAIMVILIEEGLIDDEI